MKTGVWSKDEIRTLKKLGPRHSTQHVADALGRPMEAVKKKMSRLGIYKTSAYLKRLGRTH